MLTNDSSPSLVIKSELQPPGEHDIERNAMPDTDSSLTLTGTTSGDESKQTPAPEITRDFGFLPIPRYLRYSHGKQPSFGLLRTLAFGFASTFTLANLYYCQPLLIQLALSFNVPYGEVSHITTLFQAGYAVGLIFISPLGDLLRRRPLILAMVTGSTCLTVGLPVTRSLLAFQVLSFIVGILGVTPPILVTLTADIAPPHKRSEAIAVVLSGQLFSMLIARVLGGIIGDFATWRVVYYYAIAIRATVLAICYFMIPDYPSNNEDTTYMNILATMAKFATTEPQLVQAIPITIASAACFSNFWVTITFLLGEASYNYSTLAIGLFGLIGMAGIALSALGGRLMRGLAPWYAALISTAMLFCFQVIQTCAGGINVGTVVVVAFEISVFRQIQHVAVTTGVFQISAPARVRFNAILTLSVFLGQVLGAAGSNIFLNHGWRASALFSLGLYSLQLAVLALRGPHVKRHTWLGYEGGMRWTQPPYSV